MNDLTLGYWVSLSGRAAKGKCLATKHLYRHAPVAQPDRATDF